MFFSDGRLLIHQHNDTEALEEAAHKIEKFLYEERGLQATLEPDSTQPFPAMILPAEAGYSDVENALRPHVELRAINADIIILPELAEIEIKHVFNEEELNEIASEFTRNQLDKNKLELEKKSVMAGYNARIGDLEAKITEGAEKHSAGFEMREVDAKVKINFAEGKKYYVHPEQPETILRVRDLESRDRQLRIDHDQLLTPPAVTMTAVAGGFEEDENEEEAF